MLSLSGKIIFYLRFDRQKSYVFVLFFRPDGRTFRSKQEIRQYLFIRQLDHDLELFDFRLGENFYTSRGLEVPVRARTSTIPSVRTPSAPAKKQEATEVTPAAAFVPPESITAPVSATSTPVESNLAERTPIIKLTIKSEPIAGLSVEAETPTFVPDEDGYRCPVEDCRKLFRRDNLLGVIYIRYSFDSHKLTNVSFIDSDAHQALPSSLVKKTWLQNVSSGGFSRCSNGIRN